MFYESWAWFPLLCTAQPSTAHTQGWGPERHATNRLLFTSKQVPQNIHFSFSIIHNSSRDHFICTLFFPFYSGMYERERERKWCIIEISDENVYLLNFKHQICCMKYSQTARGALEWKSSWNSIVIHYIPFCSNYVWRPNALNSFPQYMFCFVHLFVRINEYRHLCQKIFSFTFFEMWYTILQLS